MIVYVCKFCRKEFKDKEAAERHGVSCGTTYTLDSKGKP